MSDTNVQNFLERLRKLKAPFLANDNISTALQLDDEQRSEIRNNVADRVADLLDALLIDYQNDHNTRDTPHRVAKMLVDETFYGRYYQEPDTKAFDNVKGVDQLLAVGPIDVKSTCAHHMQPIIGKAWVGLLPSKDGALSGLSKYNRIVDFYARRPQIQEELTSQIADHLEQVMHPAGLIVLIKARHYCMYCRGVNQDTNTTTCVARRALRTDPSLKSEFFALIGDTDKYMR